MSPYPCQALPLQRRTKARTATLTGHYRGFAGDGKPRDVTILLRANGFAMRNLLHRVKQEAE
jgi:hypothetical protein